MLGDVSCNVLINVFYVSLICIGLYNVTYYYRRKKKQTKKNSNVDGDIIMQKFPKDGAVKAA